jgi:hypothetical protein
VTYEEFTILIQSASNPVILIEGRRSIPIEEAKCASCVASMLVQQFPHLKFRSGNASGADDAFSAGVIQVSPERLQVIAPYADHKKKQRHPLVHYDSPESLSPEELEIVQSMTIAATPSNKGLMKWYQRGGRLGAQAACLIRDTMKVAGRSGGMARPVAALFYVDPKDPEAGGTGHTIRVCQNAGVSVIFQEDWGSWG